jgi:hypothetical protein
MLRNNYGEAIITRTLTIIGLGSVSLLRALEFCKIRPAIGIQYAIFCGADVADAARDPIGKML